MRYDTVIFDLDGTLTNSHDGITNAVCYALSKMNLPIPDEAVHIYNYFCVIFTN